MMSLFRPASRYFVAVLASRWPRWLNLVVKWHDEIYYGLLCLVEAHYVRNYSASFSESFNGLQRTRGRDGGALGRRERVLSLVALIVVPYLKAKADQWYARHKDDEEKGVAVRAFPYVHAVWAGAFAAYQVAYLYERTDAYTPLLHASGVRIERLGVDEMVRQNMAQFRSQVRLAVALLRSRSWLAAARATLGLGTRLVLDYSHNLIVVMSFLINLIVWWYRANVLDSASSGASGYDMPIPPPPVPPPRPHGALPLPAAPTTCPLCLRSRTNPACPPSGFVFCYPCIFEYVQANAKCPVTFIPCTVDKIRRVYETHS